MDYAGVLIFKCPHKQAPLYKKVVHLTVCVVYTYICLCVLCVYWTIVTYCVIVQVILFDVNSARYKIEECRSEMWDLVHIKIPDSDIESQDSDF